MKQRHIVTDISGTQMGYEDGDKVTPESIAAAKETQQRERAEVFQRTGWYPRDATFHPAVIVHCPRCNYFVMRETEGQAMQVLAKHWGETHHPVHIPRPHGMAS